MIVCDQSNSEQIMNWIKDRLPEVSPALLGAYMTLGVMKNDELVAACIYYEYSGFDMKFSFAAEPNVQWATRGVMQSMFAYPFKQLKVDRVTAVTSHENTRAQSVLRRLGFQLEGIIRKGFDGSKNGFLFGAIKKDIEKWL